MIGSLIIIALQFVTPYMETEIDRKQRMIEDISLNFMFSDELLSIIERESNYKPYVISSTQDYGLYQINLIHWLSWGVNPQDYVVNGRFMMTKREQAQYCLKFVQKQVEAIINMGLYPTHKRIFDSWAGIAYVK